MAHGWAKWSKDPAAFAKLLEHLGVPLPAITAWMVTLLEFFGGLAIFVGAFVAVVSIPLVIVMLVAMFTIHLKYGFSAIKTIGLTAAGPQFGPPGIEVNLLYLAGLLILGGAGAFSVDCFLRHPRATERASLQTRDNRASRSTRP